MRKTLLVYIISLQLSSTKIFIVPLINVFESYKKLFLRIEMLMILILSICMPIHVSIILTCLLYITNTNCLRNNELKNAYMYV